MNLLWPLSVKSTRVRFCWILSHCGIEGKKRVDQLAKETLDQDIDPLASVHYTDLKPLVNSYIQQLVQINWYVAVHGKGRYLVKPIPGSPKKFKHLTRAEEVAITRHRVGHTKATKSHILSRGPAKCLFTIVVKDRSLTICFWGVRCYRNVVRNTTQTHWIRSSRQCPRLA